MQADIPLVEFCQQVERLYGKSDIMSNMHIHTHLSDCIVDYGHLHSFWLFSFELYNVILGKLPTINNRSSIILLNHFTKALFRPKGDEELKSLYSIMHSVLISSVHLGRVLKKYTNIQRTSIVVAYLNDELFGYRSEEWPVRINYFTGHIIFNFCIMVELCGRHSPSSFNFFKKIVLIHKFHDESVLLNVQCVDF